MPEIRAITGRSNSNHQRSTSSFGEASFAGLITNSNKEHVQHRMVEYPLISKYDEGNVDLEEFSAKDLLSTFHIPNDPTLRGPNA